MIYHKPVLLEESIKGLNIKPNGKYVDLTFGGGGHAFGILKELGINGKLLAFDQDKDAAQNMIPDSRLTFIHSNFRFLRNFLRFYKIEKIDGVLADLGISSHQIDVPERGFSFMKDAFLDMRMNAGAGYSAADVLNTYDENELVRVFRNYGQLANAKSIAARIIAVRKENKIERTLELVDILNALIPRRIQNKTLAQIFQALRIEVNDEVGALKDLLKQLPELMAHEGRLVFLTYHSIEDRMVKNFLKTGNIEGKLHKDFFGNTSVPFTLIQKSSIVPSDNEVIGNPRARSARLRIGEKI